MFFLTMYLQGVLGLSALETGVRFIPIAIGIAIATPVSASWPRPLAREGVMAGGLLLTAGPCGLLGTVDVSSGDLHRRRSWRSAGPASASR